MNCQVPFPLHLAISQPENPLAGEIPSSLSNCTALVTLASYENQLTGNIQSELCLKANKLQLLNLWENQSNSIFTWQITESRGHGSHLQGLLPESMENLKMLHNLNLSFNNLTGEILKTGIYKNLTVVSLMGNPGLCRPWMHFPEHEMFVEGLNLHKWVSMAYPDRMTEVVDGRVLRDVNSDERSPDEILNCVIQLLHVGLVCSKEFIRESFVGIRGTSRLRPDISSRHNAGAPSNNEVRARRLPPCSSWARQQCN
eukprot:Gb_15376 [translate_table: standard]